MEKDRGIGVTVGFTSGVTTLLTILGALTL